MLHCAIALGIICAFGAGVNAAEKTNLVQEVSANELRIGMVRLEKKERRLSIPATVNMVEGPIEYLLVSAIGKLHESVFKTPAEPAHLHTAAMLLLKDPTNSKPRISIQLAEGKTLPVEDVLDNVSPAKRLAHGAWTYLGSRLADGTFIAQRDGSIISIITDPDALIQSGRVAADDDENWRPRKEALPTIGTPVQIVLSFGEGEKVK